MSKELALKEIFLEVRTVDDDKGRMGLSTRIMELPGEKRFACARLALDQDAHV